MGIARKKITSILILLLLGFFAFGQLPGLILENYFSLPFRIHPVDVILAFIVVFTLAPTGIVPIITKYKYVFGPLLFSSLISLFGTNFDSLGILYLLRLLTYLLFIILCFEKKITLETKLATKSLLLLGFVVAILGWVQYFALPDLTSLKYLGWDDHYFRLASTFLDPAFTGMLLVFSVLVSVWLYIQKKSATMLSLSIFFILSTAFTYSRSSMLALVVGLAILLFRDKKRLFLALSFLLLAIVALLPSSMGGEGVKLARTSSGAQKIANYNDSMSIISLSPVFGVGHNNICKTKLTLLGQTEPGVNSCYGLDNSFLFIWATSGILGLFGFTKLFYKLFKNGNLLWKASALALGFHALFTNTLFYSWVIIWMAILAFVGPELRRKIKA